MEKDSVHSNRNGDPVTAVDHSLRHHANRALGDLPFVVDHRAWLRSWDERSVVLVGAVGDPDDADDHPCGTGGIGQLTILSEDAQARVDVGHSVDHRPGVIRASRDKVAETPVRGDVCDASAVVSGEPGERAELVDDVRPDLGLREVHRATAEAHEVGEAWVGADTDAAAHALGHRAIHDPRIAGVEAAGDVGRGHDLEESRIVAHRPIAVSLAEVGDQIDFPGHFGSLCSRRHQHA